MVTCGSGVMTGMGATAVEALLILQGQLRAPTGFIVAAAGTPMPGPAGRLAVTGATRRTRAAASASA